MSHLIPEVRVNKNGVPVTKHVKPEKVISSGGGFAPAPVLVDPKQSAIDLIVENLQNSQSYSMVRSAKAFLSECMDSTLNKVSEVIGSSDQPVVAQVISYAALERNEGFLLLVAASSQVWSQGVQHRIKEDGLMDEGDAQAMVQHSMFFSYKDMDNSELHESYRLLNRPAAGGFNEEECISAFKLEYLGRLLGLRGHTVTNSGYYRQLELLNNDLDGVVDVLPMVLDVNSETVVRDKYGTVTTNYLEASEIASIAKLSRTYPERIESLGDFIKQRKGYNEEAALQFLESDAPSLSAGLL